VRAPAPKPTSPDLPLTAGERPVAVFDSGVGGLTVLHECLVSLPHEDFLYLGDTERFPYGTRSATELRSFSAELAELLLDRGAKLIVVACNSASSAALDDLRVRLAGRVPVVAVVEPESRLAAAATRNGRVGLLATPTTVESGAYERALAEASGGSAELHPVACAELAPLIQAGGEVDDRTVACVERLCAPLRDAAVDTVILGCTHYPLVRPILQRALGRGVEIVTAGEAIADRVECELVRMGLAAPQRRRGAYSFLASGDPAEFRRLGTRFLALPIGRVGQVRVGRAQASSQEAMA
jgi:glutamate racemase